MAMKKCLSIITLNANGINTPIKRHKVAEWIREQDPHICCLKQTYLRTVDQYRLKVKGCKKKYSKQTDMKKKKSWGSNAYIRQNRFQSKGHQKKRQKRILHNT